MTKKTSADPLAKVRSEPGSVEDLELVNLGLPKFPEEILACRNLKRLRLHGVVSWEGDGTIPDGIGRLSKLERLELGLPCKAVPASIGDLSRLEALAFSYCRMKVMPEALGKLANLRTLAFDECEYLLSLPESIGALSKLESLTIDGQELPTKTVPAGLFRLKELKRLRLPKRVVDVPAGLGGLTELEELTIPAAALRGVGSELPNLTKLRELSLWGEAKTLPAEIGALSALRVLYLYGVGLTSLPQELAELPHLEELTVDFNGLKSLRWLVEKLPRLRKLSCDDNPLPAEEKKAIKALMKLPPAKRLGAATSTKGSKKIAAAAGGGSRGPKPKLVGEVASVNASLEIVLADAKLARAWGGVGEDADASSDWARACRAISKADGAIIEVGSGKGAVLALGVGHGFAHVFRVDDRVTFSEAFCEEPDDENFLRWIAAPPSAQAKPVATIDIPSGKLTALASTDTVADGEVVTVSVPHGRYHILTERKTSAGWGSGRRAHLVLVGST